MLVGGEKKLLPRMVSGMLWPLGQRPGGRFMVPWTPQPASSDKPPANCKASPQPAEAKRVAQRWFCFACLACSVHAFNSVVARLCKAAF